MDPLLRWDLDADQLKQLAETIIVGHRLAEDDLAAKQLWCRDDLRRLSDNEMDFSTQSSICTFPMYCYIDADIRNVASELETKLDAYCVESSMRMDMFLAVKRFSELQDKHLSSEESRYVEKLLRDYRRNGLDLEADKRERISEIKKRLSELSTAFSKNLNEDNTKEKFSLSELDGMPQDWISSLEKADEDDHFFVTLKYPDYLPLMKKCKVAHTRKRLDMLKGQMCQEINVPLFEETLVLRKEFAELLGYYTYSDYILEVRMAKNKETALSFLADLRSQLEPLARKELEKLAEYKSRESDSNIIQGYDLMYYHTQMVDQEHALDDEKIKNYFPLEKVTRGMFNIYQTLLGLRFEKVENAQVWHVDVSLYAVYDAKTNIHIGAFYLDMHPRKGKYGHAAVWGLQCAGNRLSGERQIPCCAMLCNFTKPSAEKPSLLKHGEVVTLFHEFGHVMHNICTQVDLFCFSCTKVERDFVEAPSQMLENWTFESSPLKMMSGLYTDESQSLPDEYLQAIISARKVNSGLLTLRQCFFATFDMICHTTKVEDSEALWAKLREEVSLVPQQPNCNPVAGFGHIMGGYQSGYYGYLWSEVYSADLFSKFKANPLDLEMGQRYKECILAPGGSIDGLQMVTNFLGRPPTNAPFLQHIGITK